MASRNKRARSRPDNDATVVLETPTGREDVSGAEAPGTLLDAELRSEHAADFARAELAPNEVALPHEPGNDSEATDDGLNQIEESVRRWAEDIPSGDGKEDAPPETPVFDRRETDPKV